MKPKDSNHCNDAPFLHVQQSVRSEQLRNLLIIYRGKLNKGKLTHIQPPTQALGSTIESVGKVGVMLVIGVEFTPNINEFASIDSFWWIQYIFERCCFGFRVTGGLVPVFFRVSEV